MNFNLRVLPTLVNNVLTQASHVGSLGALTVPSTTRPGVFTTTLHASAQFKKMMEIRFGDFKVDDHLRLLAAYAVETGQPLSDVAAGLYEYFRGNFMVHATHLRFVTLACGSAAKAINPKNIARQPATEIMRTTAAIAKTPVSVYQIIMTDWISKIYKDLGWLLPEMPLVYELPVYPEFPGYQDIVDLVEIQHLGRFLRELASVDLSLVRSQLEKPRDSSINAAGAVAPSLMAQHMHNAAITANDSLRHRRPAESTVLGVLSLLIKKWDPELPQGAEGAKVLAEDERVTNWTRNLSLFMAAQQAVKENKTWPNFSNEEYRDDIIPVFAEALATNLIYQSRSIVDTVGHLGVKQAFDHTGRPVLSVLFEAWDVDTAVSVFTPIRVDSRSEMRFLSPEPSLTTRFSDALAQSMQMLNIDQMVNRRLGTYDAMGHDLRAAVQHGAIDIISPMVREKLLGYSVLSSDDVEVIVASQGDLNFLKSQSTQVREIAARVYGLLHQYLVHYAVAHSAAVSIGRAHTSKAVASPKKHRALLTLQFDNMVQYRLPIGSAAIIGGRVVTCEPLEAIAYIGKRDSAIRLKKSVVNLSEFDNSLHLWGWFNSSEAVTHVAQEYSAELAGKVYKVTMQAKDILGTGKISGLTRFMLPKMAASLVSNWFHVMSDVESFLDSLLTTGDGKDASLFVTKEAVAARRSSHALLLVSQLRRIGSSTIGQTAQSFVYNSLVSELMGADNIDAITDLQRGIERVRFETWCGLAVLDQLGLVSRSQSSKLAQFIRENGAIANSVAMESDKGLY